MCTFVKEQNECADFKTMDGTLKAFQKSYQSQLREVDSKLRQAIKQLEKEEAKQAKAAEKNKAAQEEKDATA